MYVISVKLIAATGYYQIYIPVIIYIYPCCIHIFISAISIYCRLRGSYKFAICLLQKNNALIIF